MTTTYFYEEKWCNKCKKIRNHQRVKNQFPSGYWWLCTVCYKYELGLMIRNGTIDTYIKKCFFFNRFILWNA